MRKSVAVPAVVALVAAAIAAVWALWLPARHQRLETGWVAAGNRALALVSLPPAYSAATRDGPEQVCSNGPSERCFVGPGEPSAQVATVKAALAGLAVSAVRTSCFAVPLPGSPPSCHLVVPVKGSRLAVDVFARARDPRKPLSQRSYDGAFVVIHVDRR